MKKINEKITLVFLITAFIIFSLSLTASAFAEEKKLVPMGSVVGITAGLRGVCIVKLSEFENVNGEMCSPAEEAGLKAEDVIVAIDGTEIKSAYELEEFTDKSDGKKMKIKIIRNDEEKIVELTAVKSKEDNKFRLGIWIKDSASGIGTMTFYNKETKAFGALGHGICDEKNKLISINQGNIFEANVNSVVKSQKGSPGELIALFYDNENVLGKVELNTKCGVFGKLDDDTLAKAEEIPIVSRKDVKKGEASILSCVDGNNVEEYRVEIIKINQDLSDSKGMIVKITDERLLDKTGGIVRGISGSPIIKDGKFVGAITHVFVNDPTKGYGIFIEDMLNQSKN